MTQWPSTKRLISRVLAYRRVRATYPNSSCSFSISLRRFTCGLIQMRWVADQQKSLLMSSGETASSSSTLHSSKKTNKITRRMQMTLCARVSVSRNSWQVVQDGSTSQKFWVFPAFHLKLRQGSWMLISSKASRANISLFIISIWRGWERASSR